MCTRNLSGSPQNKKSWKITNNRKRTSSNPKKRRVPNNHSSSRPQLETKSIITLTGKMCQDQTIADKRVLRVAKVNKKRSQMTKTQTLISNQVTTAVATTSVPVSCSALTLSAKEPSSPVDSVTTRFISKTRWTRKRIIN